MNQPAHRISSTIARSVQDGRAVYVKQYTEGDWGSTAFVVSKRARREVDLIRRMHECGLFSQRLGVVNILSADPEKATLITAEVPGDTLAAVVTRRAHSRTATRAMFLAGRWLRQFQRLTVEAADRERISDLDPECLVEYCRTRLESLRHNGTHPIPQSLCESVLTKVHSLVEGSTDADKQLVWTHADFAPGNIIWDGHNITPIDFAMSHTDRPLLDVTYLIHRLEMHRIYRPWKRWPIETWRRAILRGYGRPDADQSPMYRAMMIKHLICRIHTYSHRVPRDLKQRLHDKWVRSIVRRRLSSLV